MSRMVFSQDIRPLSEFRSHVATFVDHVRKSNRPLIITQHGKSAAILMNVLEYESLLEKLEVLQDIYNSEEQLRQGKALPHDTAQKLVLSKLKK